MKRVLIAVVYTLGILSSYSSDGQWRDPLYDGARTEGHVAVGVTFGQAYYHGDLQHDWFSSDGQAYGGGIYFKKFRNKTLGYRFGLNYLNDINAHDSNSVNEVEQARNLRFHTNVIEANMGLELNLIRFGAQHYKVTPFVFGGFNLFYFNPWADSLNDIGKIYLKRLGTEGQYTTNYPDRVPYNLVSTGLYFGAGIKALISEQFLIGAEVGFRYLSTDYFDDVSRTYVNLDTLMNTRGRQSAEMSFRGDELSTFEGDYPDNGFVRGDPSKNDWYYSGTITLGWYFDVPERSRRYPFTKCVDTKESNPAAF